MPKVDLTELVLEINARTGFAEEFTHVSEANAHLVDYRRVSATRIQLACPNEVNYN